jgi:hypothetical protein
MNDEARAELDRILALEPAALSDADKEFLAARRSYLTEEQKVVFAAVLDEDVSSDEASADADENAVEQSRARRGRKAVEQSEA